MFESYAYLAALLVSLLGVAILDRRYRLAFFTDWRRATVTVTGGVVLFVLWDLAGISFDIFMIGDSRYVSGWRLAHEFPIEEIFFLYLLMYSALLAWRAGEKLWPRT